MSRPHIVHPRLGERVAFVLLWSVAAVVVLPIAGLLGYLRGAGVIAANSEYR